MKPFNDFTLVIQGPLHENSIYGLLNNYKEYTDNIILSHWDSDDMEMLRYISEYNLNVKIITNKMHIDYNVFNGQNVYYQVYNTLEGLKEVKTKYVIKLRTDQWFGNLTPFFESVKNNKEKYTCSNLHFRPDNLYKFHPSDKLIGGKTELIKKTFELSLYRLKNNVQALMAGAYMYSDDKSICSPDLFKKYIKTYSYSDPTRPLATQYPDHPMLGTIQILPAGYIGIVPEMLIGTSFLFSKNIFPNPDDSINIVKNNFNIVKVEDMVPYVNKFGSNEIEHNSLEIDNIEQYG
jgi:hypothetical protein